jgi:hypothetical protein
MWDRKACICGSERFDFLNHLVEQISDLPHMSEEEMRKAQAAANAPPKKRKDSVDKSKKPRVSKKKKVADLQEEDIVELTSGLDAAVEEHEKIVQLEEIQEPKQLPSFSKRDESDEEDENQWDEDE